jgi:hypothetical protein
VKKIVNLVVLASALALSRPSHATLQVVSGSCHDEQTGEKADLHNIDPGHHFGMFATGRSPSGNGVYLADYGSTMISIHMSAGRGGGVSYVQLAESGLTSVVLSVTVVKPGESDDGHFFSCDLKVQR